MTNLFIIAIRKFQISILVLILAALFMPLISGCGKLNPVIPTIPVTPPATPSSTLAPLTPTVVKTVSPPSPSPIVTFTPSASPALQTLRILQPDWENFIPGYNDEFQRIADEWAKEYTRLHGIPITVAITPTDIFELHQTLDDQLKTKRLEYDLFALILPPHRFEDSLVDLKSLVNEDISKN